MQEDLPEKHISMESNDDLNDFHLNYAIFLLKSKEFLGHCVNKIARIESNRAYFKEMFQFPMFVIVVCELHFSQVKQNDCQHLLVSIWIKSTKNNRETIWYELDKIVSLLIDTELWVGWISKTWFKLKW